jgi:hypothetical protein
MLIFWHQFSILIGSKLSVSAFVSFVSVNDATKALQLQVSTIYPSSSFYSLTPSKRRHRIENNNNNMNQYNNNKNRNTTSPCLVRNVAE